ncbi:MAG TPA: hypothetical protein VHD32_05310 [Candidatus Didemnitutus sp.]|nr:hypothetical protein [Candidatus Didemnitutus sp.]
MAELKRCQKMNVLLLLAFAALLFCAPAVAFAKRGAPQEVEPVTTATLKIVAPLDDGRVGRIQAFDSRDGRLLWSLVVFENKIDPRLEEDVQCRFIRSLKIVGDTLEVTAEGGARYRVFLSTRKVEPLATAKEPNH